MSEIRFLSLGEAARRSGMSKATIQRILIRGELKATQADNKVWQIPVEEMDTLLRIRDSSRQGRRSGRKDEQNPERAVDTITLFERLIAAETARADAAERRYDELVQIFGARKDV
jgi:hypothetical protein